MVAIILDALPYLESARFALHVLLSAFALGFFASGATLFGIGLARLIVSADIIATLGVMIGRQWARFQNRTK